MLAKRQSWDPSNDGGLEIILDLPFGFPINNIISLVDSKW